MSLSHIPADKRKQLLKCSVSTYFQPADTGSVHPVEGRGPADKLAEHAGTAVPGFPERARLPNTGHRLLF